MERAPLDELESLLAGIATIEVRRHGFVRRLTRTARAGGASGVDLIVRDGTTALRTFTIALPDEPDLLAPPLAEAVRTTSAIRARFGKAIDGLRTISFDHSDAAMRDGRMAGNAHLNMSTIHLNASYVTARGLAAEAERLGRPGISMSVLVAHELWHLIELAWEVRDYRTTVEFRRELGSHFGVETLEHALRGHPHATDQLRAEVSTYATTNPKEATAEMFEQWWLGRSETPAVVWFGTLVERYFPR